MHRHTSITEGEIEKGQEKLVPTSELPIGSLVFEKAFIFAVGRNREVKENAQKSVIEALQRVRLISQSQY